MLIKHDMADDMANSAMIREKVKDDRYAQNLYAAMCNMRWQKSEVWPVLNDDMWSCTWRSSGGIVAELQGKGDYLDWYCSGMGGIGVYDYLEDTSRMESDGYVTESHITDEIKEDLATLGWHPVPWEDDKESK